MAAGLVTNQLGLPNPFRFWTMVAALLAVALLINCIVNRTISTLPFVVAMVYIVLRDLGFVPFLPIWAVLVTAGLVSAGIGVLFPQRLPRDAKFVVGSFFGDDADDWDEEDWDGEGQSERRAKARVAMGGIDNNPAINVTFGAISRYLHADQLETVSLSCSFGGMDIYFDQAELSSQGATVYVDCKFGGIDLYVPRHWRIDEQISCMLGGVDVNNTRLATLADDAPTLTITGNVLCGGVDIWYI